MTQTILILAQTGEAQTQAPQAQPQTPAASQPAPAAPRSETGKNVTVIGLPNAPANTTSPTATTQAVPTSTPSTTPTGSAPPQSMLLFIAIAMVAIMIIPTFFSQRKEKKQKAQLMESLRKGERVMTLGGLIGTIVDIDGGEVILKIEDGRIRVAKSAIQQVIDSKSGAASSVEPKDKSAKPELAGSSN